MARALIGLGSNLGDRQQTLNDAVAELATLERSSLLGRSRWHETAPIGGPMGQPRFLNGAVTLETSLAPLSLLSQLQRIELLQKRARHEPWGARTLDLDLLLYDDLLLETPALTIPHPRMAFRRFVLSPASEVAADWRHPGIGWTIGQLLAHLDTAPPYVAVAGVSAAARQALAAALAETLEGKLVHSAGGPLADTLGDPSGRNLQPAIELLDKQAELLQPAAASAWVVSDFWFGQLLAEAAVALEQDACASFQQHWRERNREVLQPKLIIWLSDPPDESREEGEEGTGGRLAGELARWIGRPGWGPVLKINRSAPISPLADAVAAIEAMA